MLTFFLLKLFLLTNTIVIEKPPITIEAEITMYNPVEWQTNEEPNITASGKEVNEITAACPEWLEFGQLIEVDGKVWECQDRMALRYRSGNYFDLLTWNYEEAIQWGRKTKTITILR